ncbi:MAG: precorrin-8X methylmutase [Clostridia bacterium]|nr:precorrin-8X methylmutase [Clostridia bacterium]
MQRRSSRDTMRKKNTAAYVTSEMAAIMQRVSDDLDDSEITRTLHFSPTALTVVRHVMMMSGCIVTDTMIMLSEINRQMLSKLSVSAKCYVDDPQILDVAEQRHTTRAGVAIDYALALPGLKMIAIGSAPGALERLLQRNAVENLTDVVVVAAPTGFASVVQLKERLWESRLPCIVLRGKRGGPMAASSIVNALLAEAIKAQCV